MKHFKIITPNNFNHKAGDGMTTRDHRISDIVPALQANCGNTQCSYVLETDDTMSWWWEQCVYKPTDIVRALKAGGGSGNIPKVIIKEDNNV